jgi:PAS domain S-box-containing protein
VESSSDAIVSFDLDRKILSWNPAAEQMFGYTAAEALGRPLELFVPPGLEAEPTAILERVWRGEHVNQYDTLRLHKNGTPVEVTLTVSPIKNDRGEVVAATTIVQDIRQRKRTERALRESEERYRELVEQVRDHAIFSTDPQGIITTWNEGCQKLLGYAQGEFIGMDFCHLFTPEDRQADIPLQELQTAARQGSCSDDRWMVRKGGERFWASGTTNAVREPSGKLSGFTKVMRDLTAQMQAETALRQSQERLALTLEAGGLGIWDSDLLRRRTYWSPEQERLFGLEPGGFDGHFSSRLHPEDRRRVLLRLREALEGGGNYQDEYRVVWPDGTVRWLAARGRVYRDQEGRAVRILGVNFDITERRRAESALQESEERFRAMADSTPVMIWVTDPKGRVEFVNRAYTEFFGVSAEHVRQNGWQPLVHPEDQEGYTRPFLECLRERRTFWGQARVRHRSGAWRWVASYAAPRFSASGEFLGMVGSSPDISEIKEAEERLREAVETQRRFVADASHELRAPLASVLGNLELLRRYPDMPEEDHQLALHDAYSEARRMSRLVHDLLALARGDGGLRLRWQTVQLDTLLAEAIRQTSALSQEHHFVPALEPVSLEGDPDRLKELLLILLDNALKYTPPGGTIRLELKQTERHAELRVSDTGIGIAPEDLPHVFERFYRADRARVRIHDPGDPGGTGLGLSIAKQIVEAHQGKIGLESQLSRGTTVWVLLPLS